MSTIKVTTLSTQDGAYSISSDTLTRAACRAWVNFNGTGTVAIRSQHNVTSITDNGTGDYTVNFTTAMPDVNYVVAGTVSYWDTPNGRGSTWLEVAARSTMLTTSVRVLATSAGGIFDLTYNGVAIFR